MKKYKTNWSVGKTKHVRIHETEYACYKLFLWLANITVDVNVTLGKLNGTQGNRQTEYEINKGGSRSKGKVEEKEKLEIE